MATVASLLQELRRLTRPDRAAEWDPVGLQFGDPSRNVERVAVCHEVTEAAVQALLAEPTQLVITYHPLLFRPTNRLVAGPSPAGRAYRLMAAGLSLAVTHTDFDAAPGGTAESLAQALGLVDVLPFGPLVGTPQVKVVTFAPEDAVEPIVEAMSRAGGGRIGNYESCSYRTSGLGSFLAGEGAAPVVGRTGTLNVEPEVRVEMIAPTSRQEAVIAALVAAHPYEEPAFDVYDVRSNHGMIGRVGSFDGTLEDLAETVGSRLGRAGLRVAGDLRSRPGRVAVVPGSGGSFVSAARHAGADVLVTGDVDHHRAVAALDSSLAVVDPGHAATELPGMKSLVDKVSGLGTEVLDLTGDGRGPWTGHLLGQLR